MLLPCFYYFFLASSRGNDDRKCGQDLINFSYSAGFDSFARKKDTQKELPNGMQNIHIIDSFQLKLMKSTHRDLIWVIKPMSAIRFDYIHKEGIAMCLYTITETLNPLFYKVRKAWKIVKGHYLRFFHL